MTSNVVTFVVFCVAIGLVRGDVSYDLCDSANLATITHFTISNCPDGATSCQFEIGQTYTFSLEALISTQHPPSTKLPFKVVGNKFGIPFVLVEGDACERMNCPISPGQLVTIRIDHEIPEDTPALSNVSVYARVWSNDVGSNDEASLCASIKVSIVE